jgi:hypothetical protein
MESGRHLLKFRIRTAKKKDIHTRKTTWSATKTQKKEKRSEGGQTEKKSERTRKAENNQRSEHQGDNREIEEKRKKPSRTLEIKKQATNGSLFTRA